MRQRRRRRRRTGGRMAKSNTMSDKLNTTVGQRQRAEANNLGSNPTLANPTHLQQYESRMINPMMGSGGQ